MSKQYEALTEIYLPGMPLAEQLPEADLLRRLKDSRPPSDKPHDIALYQTVMAWNAVELALCPTIGAEEATDHFDDAAIYAMRARNWLGTSFHKFVSPSLLDAYLPVFTTRRPERPDAPPEMWESVEQQTANLLENALNAEVHPRRDDHFEEPGHLPCFESKPLRRAGLGHLTLMTAGLLAGYDVFPSSYREIKNPPRGSGLPREAHELYVLHEGQKVPIKISWKEQDNSENKAVKRASVLDLVQGACEQSGLSMEQLGALDDPEAEDPIPASSVARIVADFAREKDLEEPQGAFVDAFVDATDHKLQELIASL